ncbi:MAG: phage virion morphogenesis protein [Rhizobiaceae bacterium]
MVGVKIEVKGSKAADAALAEAVARIDNPRELYDDIGVMLTGSTQFRFETETDPEGNPWPMSLRVQLEGGKTLTDTGFLASSITHEVGDDSVAVGTNAIQAAIHQHGGVIKAKTAKGLRFRPLGGNSDIIRKSVTMPRRAFLGVDPDDEKGVIELVEGYIGEPLHSGGSDAR